MSDAREAVSGTKANVKDTCGLSRYAPYYSGYASYADQELFCRVKQGLAPLGDVGNRVRQQVFRSEGFFH